jgi:hypothetical protein
MMKTVMEAQLLIGLITHEGTAHRSFLSHPRIEIKDVRKPQLPKAHEAVELDV